MDRRKTLGIVTASAMTVIGLALSAIIFKSGTPFSTPTQAGSYTLTLNNSNGVSGSSYSGTKTITTDSGDYHVDFDYTSCSSMSGGHAVIANGGKIVNKDHIRSIYQVVANFSGGTLKFRSSYDGATWSGYTTMTSLQPYSLGSNPYYIELSASESNVNLTSVTYSYTCLENPEAAGTTTTTDDTWERVSSNSDLQSGDEVVIVTSYTSGSTTQYFTLQDETVGGKSYYLGAESISLTNSQANASVTSSHTVWTITSGSTSGTWKLNSNGQYLTGEHDSTNNYWSLGLSNSYNSSICDWTITFSSSSVDMLSDDVYVRFKYYSTNDLYEFYGASGKSGYSSVDKYRYIYKKIPGESHTDYPIPVDETGFTAVDNNKNTYTTNSIFDNANGLDVRVTFTDSTSKVLTSEQYSYVVKNSNGVAIDTSVKFPEAGTYTLVVSYASYIPVEIQLNVGVYTYLTSISARMTNTAFTTADTLSNSISGALEVDMHYNVSSADKTVYYSNLSENNLSLALLDPNGVAKNLNSPFGVAGTWKVKVTSTLDSSIFSEVSLTVSAIQVIDISLNRSDLVLHTGESAQLTVTFNPENATDQGVTWTSSDSTKVSVTGNGVTATVTANAITTEAVTITATSVSNPAKSATCSVTVKKVVTSTATIVPKYTGSSSESTNIVDYIDKSEFTTDGITLTNASASGYIYPVSGNTGAYRFGKSSGTGSVTFEFANTVITGVSLNMMPWSGDTSTVKVSTSANSTGETITLDSSSAKDYVTTAFSSDTSESSSLTIQTTTNSKGRIYLYGITLTIGVAEPVYPESISLTNQSINIGESVTLEPVFTPSDTNQTALTWSSSNASIATVDENGLVTGVAQGTVTITATGKDEYDNDVVGTCSVTVNTVAVTGVSVKSTDTVAVGQSITLTATVSPSNATDKVVTWSSSNTSKATVNANTGLVTGVAAGTAVITATTHDGGFTAQCTVTVSTVQLDEWTLLFYVCGTNLESDPVNQGGGSAKSDLQEILSVRSSQPSTVNIAVETGGCTYWRMPNVKNDELGRWEIGNISGCSNTAMKKIDAVEDASMGESSTLQDFLEWGIQAYPARKYGLFMWNHGGAMDGCCFDDNHDGDGLYSNEVDAAVTAAKQTRGISENLEFIAYDACLMAVQDIAEFNSHNFNYMISSQETEWSGGYDYDAWLPTLYADPSTVSTTTVLSKVGDTFMDYYENAGKNDQTQAVYDLSKMAAYKTAFETMTDSLTAIVNSSSKWDAFAAKINTAKKYAYDEDASDYNGGYVYDIFDAKGALTALKNDSTYNSAKSKIEAVLSLLTIGEGNLIVYERHGSEMGGSNGMCLFCPISGYNQVNGAYFNTSSGQKWFDANYSAERTNFTKWQAFVAQYGNWAA